MKKILLSLAALGAVAAAAAPAAAQDYGRYGRYGGYGDYGRYGGYHQDYRTGRLTTPYVDSLDWKIVNAAREGRISWGEARDLRREFREVQPIAWRVQTGEARPWEVARLDRVVSRIEAAVGRGGYAWRGGYDGRRYGYDRDDWQR
jgi:hypothetical protein